MLRVVLALLLLPGVLPGAELGWDPERTWAFVVGVLEWKDSKMWSSFESLGRCDEELVRLLKTKGVPKDQIVYLQDEEATLKKLRKELKRLLGKTREGDFLLVYYAGHGFVEKGEYFLANYDCGKRKKSWWPGEELVDQIEEEFRGERSMILVDCCYSGRLAEEVDAYDRRVGFGAFGSSSARESSTGNWTFTEAVLAALNGHPVLDRDGDGAVRARELGQFISEEMQAFAEQRSACAFTGAFSPDTVLAKVERKRRHEREGERVEFFEDGKWWQGRIVDIKGEKALVNWIENGFHRAEDVEWAKLSELRPISATTWPVGARVEVEWEKKWYPAKILEVDGVVHLVHYDGYGEEWDEWVGGKRIRGPGRAQ